jgi:hypothetical protein
MSHFEIVRMKGRVAEAQAELDKAKAALEVATGVMLSRPETPSRVSVRVYVNEVGGIDADISTDRGAGITLPAESAMALGGFLVDLYGYSEVSAALERARNGWKDTAPIAAETPPEVPF